MTKLNSSLRNRLESAFALHDIIFPQLCATYRISCFGAFARLQGLSAFA